jgi:hypothetical protein
MRRILHVGSYPLPSSLDAMLEMIKLAGPSADLVPNGEPGRRFIQREIETLAACPEVRVLYRGQWRGYWDIPLLVRRAGDRLPLALPYADEASYAGRELERIQRQDVRPELRQLATLPDPMQIPAFTQGLRRDYETFAAATVRQVEQIQHDSDGQAVVQVEVPYQTVMTHLRGGAYARRAARRIADYVARCPAGTRFGVHLCWGDLCGQSVLQFLRAPRPGTETTTLLANELAEAWPSGRTLDYVHIPVADGGRPPSLQSGVYDPMTRLALPETCDLALGLAHDDASFDELKVVRDNVEGLTGREVVISAPCGKGCMSHSKAIYVAALERELAAS